MTDRPANLVPMEAATPTGVIGSLKSALQFAEETPMVGCLVVLFDADARCWQFRELSRRRRLETIAALQLALHDLCEEHNNG